MADTKVDRFEHYAPIIKATRGGYVLAPVLLPNKEDGQGDICDEETIAKAMESFADNGRKIDHQHQSLLTSDDAQVIESYVLRSATTIGGVALPRGTWMLGLRLSPRLRKEVAEKKITGLSIRGRGTRTPID